MRILLFTIIQLLWISSPVFSSGTDTLEITNKFDFWVGSWQVHWINKDGTTAYGTNDIEKILDGKVIRENFKATDAGPMSGFEGKSFSVYNAQRQEWRQTWVDNQGGYITFTGEFDGDKRIFETTTVERDGKQLANRMVFYEIKADSFTWDWMRTDDGGKTWSLLWRIYYVREP